MSVAHLIDGYCWLEILAYAAISYSEALAYSFTCRQFYYGFRSIFESSANRVRKHVALPAKYTSFWNGVDYHYSFWNKDIPLFDDAFCNYLLLSLKNCNRDKSRTEQLLCYMVESGAFEEGHMFASKHKEYLKNLTNFAREYLGDPRLYAYLQMRREALAIPSGVSSFSDWMKILYGEQLKYVHWLMARFRHEYLFLTRLVEYDSSGGLQKRLYNIYVVFHGTRCTSIFTLIVNVLIIMGCIFTAMARSDFNGNAKIVHLSILAIGINSFFVIIFPFFGGRLIPSLSRRVALQFENLRYWLFETRRYRLVR